MSFIFDKMLNNEEFINLTEGIQKRDFIYYKDLLDAVLLSIDKWDVSIGSGKSYQIRDVVELVKKSCGNNNTLLNWGRLPSRGNEVMNMVGGLSVLKEWNWGPNYTLNDGIIDIHFIFRGVNVETI